MAIHYNLAKVFERTNGDDFLVKKEIKSFIIDIPLKMKNLISNIKNKQYQVANDLARNIKPSLELMGMTIAYDEIIQVENWTIKQGKRREIEATVESIKTQIEKAVKEMNKEYKVFEILKTM